MEAKKNERAYDAMAITGKVAEGLYLGQLKGMKARSRIKKEDGEE
jgi:hypothetical protein